MWKLTGTIFFVTALLYPGTSAGLDGVCVKFCDDGPSSSSYSSSGSSSSGYTSPAPVLTPEQLAEIKASQLNQLGISQRKKGECREAIQTYDQALELHSGISDKILRNKGVAQDCLGFTAYNQGDYATALQWFEKAFANNPDDNVIRSNYETTKQVYQNYIHEQERLRQQKNARLALENVLMNASAGMNDLASGKQENKTSLQFMDMPKKPSREGYFDTVGVSAFSAGTSDTAPVPMGGVSRLAVSATPLPVITPDQLAGGKAPAGEARYIKNAHLKPLLSGQKLEVRRNKARAANAMSMARKMMGAGQLDKTRTYIQAAIKNDPDCSDCRQLLEKIEKGEGGLNLEDPEQRGRMSMILGDEAHALDLDMMPEARLFDSQGMLVTKAEFMLAALEYGETWQDAVKFLSDARSLYPADKEIPKAIEEIKAIFSSKSTP